MEIKTVDHPIGITPYEELQCKAQAPPYVDKNSQDYVVIDCHFRILLRKSESINVLRLRVIAVRRCLEFRDLTASFKRRLEKQKFPPYAQVYDTGSGVLLDDASNLISKEDNAITLRFFLDRQRYQTIMVEDHNLKIATKLELPEGRELKINIKLNPVSNLPAEISLPFGGRISWFLGFVFLLFLLWALRSYFSGHHDVYRAFDFNSTEILAVISLIFGYFCLPSLRNIASARRWLSYLKFPELYFDAVIIKLLRNWISIAVLLLVTLTFFEFERSYSPLSLPDTANAVGASLIPISETRGAFQVCGSELANLVMSSGTSSRGVIRKLVDQLGIGYLVEIITPSRKKMPGGGSPLENSATHIYRADVPRTCLGVPGLSSDGACLAYLYTGSSDNEVKLKYVKFDSGEKEALRGLDRSVEEVLSKEELGKSAYRGEEFSKLEAMLTLLREGEHGWDLEVNTGNQCMGDDLGDEPVLVLQVERKEEVSAAYKDYLFSITRDERVRQLFNISSVLPHPSNIHPIDEALKRLQSRISRKTSEVNRDLSLRRSDGEQSFEFSDSWVLEDIASFPSKNIFATRYEKFFYGSSNSKSAREEFFFRQIGRRNLQAEVRKYYYDVRIILEDFRSRYLKDASRRIDGAELEMFYQSVFARIPERDSSCREFDTCIQLRNVRADAVLHALLAEKTFELPGSLHSVIMDYFLLRDPNTERRRGFFAEDMASYLILSAATGQITQARLDAFERFYDEGNRLGAEFFGCYMLALKDYVESEGRRQVVGMGIYQQFPQLNVDIYRSCDPYFQAPS